MPDDFFFSPSQLKTSVRRPLSVIPKCGACGLFKTCRSPKMPPSGKGKRKVLIVGEFVGGEEDRQGKQFVGKAGQILRKVLTRIGVSPDKDCWMTNAVICHQPGAASVPSADKVQFCRPNLVNTLEELNPEVIIPLGGLAVKSVIGHLWKDEDVGGVNRWAGFRIPVQKTDTWVCPSFHPSFLDRAQDPVLNRMFEVHLREAFALDGRPWGGKPPRLASSVTITLDADEAAAQIEDVRRTRGLVAFDFETNALKPDSKKAEIICCSVCWKGKKTTAYPWHGRAIQATLDLLWDRSVPKIGYNLKFEESWVLAKYGRGVRNWVWDGMQAAHVLDNRKSITGLKFQAFVRMGMDPYDEAVRPYFETDGEGNKINRAREVPLTTLLQYCGTDSLLEYHVGMRQMEELGMKDYYLNGVEL